MDKWNELSRHCRQGGLSLLGVVIAVLLLSGGVVVISQLMVRTSDVAGSAEEKFIATNLAREGLELVHAKRDTNWFSPDESNFNWVDEICSGSYGSDIRFTIEYNPQIDTENIYIVPGPSDEQKELYLVPESVPRHKGRWTHIQPSAGDKPTLFSRGISVDCQMAQGSNAVSPPILPHITVTSKASWFRRGKEQSVILKEILYNWYRLDGQAIDDVCTSRNPLINLIDQDGGGATLQEANRLFDQIIECKNKRGDAGAGIPPCYEEHYDLNRDGVITQADANEVSSIATLCSLR